MKSIKTVVKNVFNAWNYLTAYIKSLDEELQGKVLTPALRKSLIKNLSVDEYDISAVIYDDNYNDFLITDDKYDAYFKSTLHEDKEYIVIDEIQLFSDAENATTEEGLPQFCIEILCNSISKDYITSIQYDGKNLKDVIKFIPAKAKAYMFGDNKDLVVETLTSTFNIKIGEYIIKSMSNKLSTCSSKAFKGGYEAVEANGD